MKPRLAWVASTPSAVEEPPPATVAIVPFVAMARTTVVEEPIRKSVMRTTPAPAIPTSIGLPSWAAVAGPPSPAVPWVPLPANVTIAFDTAPALGALASAATTTAARASRQQRARAIPLGPGAPGATIGRPAPTSKEIYGSDGTRTRDLRRD